jgi:hypothetical protein
MDPTKLCPQTLSNMDSSIQNKSQQTTNEPPKVIYMMGYRNDGKSQLYPLMHHIFGEYAHKSPNVSK